MKNQNICFLLNILCGILVMFLVDGILDWIFISCTNIEQATIPVKKDSKFLSPSLTSRFIMEWIPMTISIIPIKVNDNGYFLTTTRSLILKPP